MRHGVHLYGSRQVDTAKLIDCSHTAALQPTATLRIRTRVEASYSQKPGENVQRGRAEGGGRKVLGGRGGSRSYTNSGRGRGGSHCLGRILVLGDLAHNLSVTITGFTSHKQASSSRTRTLANQEREMLTNPRTRLEGNDLMSF